MISLEELLAQTLENAYALRDASPDRELSLVITKLEEAALWLCNRRASEHLGENSLLDWLRQI